MENQSLKIVLDATPNVFHTGMYVALGKAWFAQEGISVRFISPDEYAYHSSSAQKLAEGKVDIAILRPEELIYLNLNGLQWPVMVLATLTQQNSLALGVRKELGVVRPAHFDDKRYAHTGLPYEQKLLRWLIKQDKGRGKYELVEVGYGGGWRAFLRNQVDVVQYYTFWEGVDACCRQLKLNSFMLSDLHIPYRYTHLLCVRQDTWLIKQDSIKRFLRVVKEGYLFTEQHPESAANLLMEYGRHASLNNIRFVYQAQLRILPHYGGKCWGMIQPSYWQAFWAFLLEHKIVSSQELNHFTSQQSTAHPPVYEAVLMCL